MFKSLVDKIVATDSKSNMSLLIGHAENQTVTNDEIAYLAKKLADSGDSLKVSSLTADIPSTGGPSSLSTLICPLILSEFYKVPKLGVSGRPAGGLDVLAQVPGYKVYFNKNEIEDLLLNHNYVHFIANESFAPLDQTLFSFRKEINKVDIPVLVVASLLSKKIACGLKHVGLDVRISNFGNFGRSFHEAKKNAKRFKQVGELLGIKVKCFLSDSNFAYQPYIGRGEALIALNNIFSNNLNSDYILKQHLDYCLLMASTLSEKPVPENINTVLRDNFFENLQLQGSMIEAFDMKVNEILERDQIHVEAKQSGFVIYDLEKVRNKITEVQKEFITNESVFPDPVGVVLKKDYGTYVYKGEPIAEIRYDRKFLNKKSVINAFHDVANVSLNLEQGRNFIFETYG